MPTFTVLWINGAIRTSGFRGTFANVTDAKDFADKERARSQSFMSYEVWTGDPNRPGRKVEP